ncbi:MAG: carboxypeptidase M32 [Anaerolineales bacterium]|nr:carboxypeptidase M32 [Anaerolineales bacterium]
MTTPPLAFSELKTQLAEIHDLNKISWVLNWDQHTMMAPGGAAVRAEQLATVNKLAHEKFTTPEIGRRLEELAGYEASLPYDSDEASLIRVTRRDYLKAVRVPTALRAEMARAAGLARPAWVAARQQSNYELFRPHLEHTLELKHQLVECLAEAGQSAYDVLLDDYEPGMKTADVQTVFTDLKTEIVPLIAAIRERAAAVSDAPVHQPFPPAEQEAFCLKLLGHFGFSRQAWRLDPTVHPFASNSATQDIRITTRYYPDFINPALFGSMHEFGHGLYEHQVSPALERTPLCRGASLGIHESQSRLWENLVGRSRPFWQFLYPQLQAAFPAQLAGVDLEAFYRAINIVQPSFIRVEADEATYGLHIILRFELEQALMAGEIPLRDLPAAWNTRFKAYFGVDVPDDAQGVLQDVHWSGGMLGYFPTYALGSIIASQLWEKIQADLPDLPARLARGDVTALRDWLRVHIHQHGRKFTPAELLQRVVGGPINVGPYVRYLRSKFSALYGLS